MIVCDDVVNLNISIHAPPRGATTKTITNFQKSLISIHAPPRGATENEALRFRQNAYFNSRPSARGDPDEHRHPHPRRISIHAPPRGATTIAVYSAGRIYFNSRPSARGDGSPRRARRRTKNFNSRPSARGDSKRYAISANLLFNPYKSAWLNNNATQFVEIILVIFHRIIA